MEDELMREVIALIKSKHVYVDFKSDEQSFVTVGLKDMSEAILTLIRKREIEAVDNFIHPNRIRKLFKYIMEGNQGTFRYLIYEIMGYELKDYSWWYSTGLMAFKDYVSDLQDENKKLKQQLKEVQGEGE